MQLLANYEGLQTGRKINNRRLASRSGCANHYTMPHLHEIIFVQESIIYRQSSVKVKFSIFTLFFNLLVKLLSNLIIC